MLTPTQLDQANVLTARLTQATALIEALQSAAENNGDMPLAKDSLQGSLWAVQELLGQAQRAASGVTAPTA
jgi:hypothetical protein